VLADEKEKVVSLDDKVSKWLPQLPHADEVTLEQLATMTSGYQDYVADPAFGAAIYADPFQQWMPDELLAYAVDKPLWYVPGENWNYAHTNYVILGLALEKATGRPINDLLQEKVLGPLGLTNTVDPGNAAIAAPVLHAYSSERRFALGIPAGDPFYEETTFWSPSWTLTRGAIQTTNIFDMNATAVAIGSGTPLTPASYQRMVSTRQRTFGGPVPGCDSCRMGTDNYT